MSVKPTVGLEVDALDRYGVWRPATILRCVDGRALVSFPDLSAQYVEYVATSGDYMAQRGTKTPMASLIDFESEGTDGVSALIESCIAGFGSDDDLDYLATRGLLDVVNFIFGQKIVADKPLPLSVFRCLRGVVEFLVKFLGTTAPLPASLLRCLEIITATVSSADKFYTDVKTEAIPESCACFLNASGASSERLYSSLINHFGALGGFEMMIQRLLQRAPLLIPLHEVEVYVAVFACKRLRGSATLANDIVPRGLEAACLRVIRITSVDEEEFARPSCFELIHVTVRETLEMLLKGAATRVDFMHTWKGLFLMGFKTVPTLLAAASQEMKEAGLKYLCVLATAVKPVTEVRVDVISPATFTEWLAMKQIIPTLVNLVTDMVISDLALSSILSIALVCGKGDSPVTTAVLDELWEIVDVQTKAGKGTSTSRKILYNILSTTTDVTVPAQVEALQSRITAIPDSGFDSYVVGLIVRLVKDVAAAEVTPEYKSSIRRYGVEVLVGGLTGRQSPLSDTCRMCARSVVDLVSSAETELLKDQALSWVGHIASGDHSLAGCILIKEMLDRPSLEASHPSCADGCFTCKRGLRALFNSRLNVVQSILCDLERVFQSVQQLLDELNVPVSATIRPTHIGISHFWYSVDCRLETLQLFAKDVTFPDYERLYGLFVESPAADAKSRNTFFRWLENLLKTCKGSVDENPSIRELVEGLLLHPSRTGPCLELISAWAVLWQGFRYLNEERGVMNGFTLLRPISDVVGLGAVWEVFAKGNREVSADVGSKLVPLYVYGAHVEGCDQADATAAFYDKVFNVLEAAAQSNQPERVEVCLGTFEPFFEALVTVNKSMSDFVFKWEVTLKYSDGDMKKTVLLPARPTVGQIRVGVGKLISYPPNRIRVHGADLSQYLSPQDADGVYFDTFGLPPATVSVTPLVRVMQDTEEFDMDKIWPATDSAAKEATVFSAKSAISKCEAKLSLLLDIACRGDRFTCAALPLLTLLDGKDSTISTHLRRLIASKGATVPGVGTDTPSLSSLVAEYRSLQSSAASQIGSRTTTAQSLRDEIEALKAQLEEGDP